MTRVRFLRFNAVGVVGFVVQIAVVGVLTALLHTRPLVATAVAVEAAILHNFFWHERWTWADRPAAGRTRLTRLSRFHLTNGLVSIAGNVAIVLLLSPVVSGFSRTFEPGFSRTFEPGFSRTYGLLGANAIAVLVCSLVNFAAGDRLVFSPPRPRQT